jgi:type I restriction enzyme, S subunit
MSELSVGWTSSSLLNIIDLHDSQRIPLNQKQRAECPGDYPYYGANGQVDSIDGFIFDGNYILLAEDGGYFNDLSRSVAYEVSGRFWVNNHAHILSPCSEIPRRFLTYALNSLDWMPYVGGSTRLKLTQESLRRVFIPLPPLPEQHRIVAKLDSLFTRSRRAREELERVPGLCDRYKQAVLAAAFRGDLTADWREENNPEPLLENKLFINSQQSELSDLPDEWVWTNVGQIAKVTGGLTKNQNRMKLERKVSYLRVANVYANELRLNEVLEIGITDAEWERVQLKTGDLLIVEGNGSIDQVGRVALWNGEIEQCAHQNHLIKVRVGNFISQKFLLHWLLSPNGRRTIELIASSSAGLHTLSISKVMTLPTPLCSIKEMEIIIRRVEKLFKAIDSIAQDYQKARQLLDRLDQATLAKAFRGELVPQDPNDEPAAALLERIQAERQAEPKGKAVRSKKSQS